MAQVSGPSPPGPSPGCGAPPLHHQNSKQSIFPYTTTIMVLPVFSNHLFSELLTGLLLEVQQLFSPLIAESRGSAPEIR